MRPFQIATSLSIVSDNTAVNKYVCTINKSSAVAEMAAQYCTSRIFAVKTVGLH